MPFSMTQFMSLVVAQNRSFGRIKGSSLDPLLAILQAPNALHRKAEIANAVAFIPYQKQMKYQQALNYLRIQMPITEIPQIPYAIPVDPKMELDAFKVMMRSYVGGGILNPGSYHHEFRLSWKSSNGHLASLARCGTRENVKFRSAPDQPPFNYVQKDTPMQFTQGATTNNGANAGCCIDDHSTVIPSIICTNPRVPGELVAEQIYEYTTDGTNWREIPGARFLLKKGVRTSGAGFVFYFAKTNWAPHNQKTYRFEVEYPIGPAPAAMPAVGEKLGRTLATPADISTYGRVVSSG